MPPSEGWVPPDGGYGWVIVGSCLVVMLFAAQSFIDFGIFLIAFIEFYEASTTIVAVVGSIQMSASGFCCLIWGPAVQRFGSKKCLVVGTLFVGVGYVISMPMGSVYALLFTYGLLPGIGFASYYMVAAVHVQFYFDKRRALAVSVMMTGLALGGFLWPPFSQWLISNYGWRGAVLIQTALHLHIIPFAILLRPPIVRGAHPRILSEKTVSFDVATTAEVEKNGVADKANGKDAEHDGNDEKQINIHADEKSVSSGDYKKNNNSKAAAAASNTPQQQQQQQRQQGQFLKMVLLLKRPSFLAYCIVIYFVHQGHLGVLTFMSLRGLGVGATKANAAFLLSIAAIFNGSLRILFGYLGDRFRHRRIYMYGFSALCGGILTLVSIRFETYFLLAVYAAGWGIVASCCVALQNTIPMDLVGRENTPLAVACVWFFTGIAYLTSYPLAGILLDRDPTAKNFCYVQGVPQVIGGLLMALVAYLHHKEQVKEGRPINDKAAGPDPIDIS